MQYRRKKLRFFELAVSALFLCACAADTRQTGGDVPETAGALETIRVVQAAEEVWRPYGTVAVCSESLADLWLLAGGEIAAATDDCFQSEYQLGIPEETARNLGSVLRPDLEGLISLQPDLVLLSEAITGHKDLQEVLEQSGIETKYFDIETFGDYLSALEYCTKITGRTELYEKNGLDVQEKIDGLLAQNRFEAKILLLRANSTKLAVKSSDGSMAGLMLRELGCTNIADRENALLEELNIETILAQEPEYLFITIQGEPEAAVRLVEETLREPAWQSLGAVKGDQVFLLDKELFHLKPNERWAESYQTLIDILASP